MMWHQITPEGILQPHLLIYAQVAFILTCNVTSDRGFKIGASTCGIAGLDVL